MSVPKILYSTGLDDVASRWLKNTQPADQRQINADIKREVVAAAEALMIAPRVCFRVYGENVVLVLLIRAFGVKEVERLLEEHALEFHLWSHQIFTIEDVNLVRQGLNPLAAGGRPTTAVHSDPEPSAQEGLAKWGASLNLDRKVRRHLARLVAKRTTLPSTWISEWAVNRTTVAYANGEIESLGFDSNVPLHEAPPAQWKQLSSLAAKFATTADLMEHEYDLYQSAETWETLLSLFSQLMARDRTRAVTEQILAFHHLPSIPRLLTDGVVSIRDIPRLRAKQETADFRAWLWAQPDPLNAEAVAQAYLAALDPRINVTEKRWFKAAHIGTAWGIGVALGALPFGPIVNAALSAAQTASDTIATDKLARKKDPRRFATDVVGTAVARFEFASKPRPSG